MKGFKSIIVMLAAGVLALSCSKDEPAGNQYLPVTSNNISGQWQVVEWNGAPFAEGTWLYLEFVRKDAKLTIYQNFDSMGQMPHVITGVFNIIKDDMRGYILQGMYDNDEGMFAHKYIVQKLTKNSMEWVAEDDPAFVMNFERCVIPDGLKK